MKKRQKGKKGENIGDCWEQHIMGKRGKGRGKISND